ncbi:MAG: Cysteine desulfurase, SufS subfamily [Microgenomates group bacterium GW2011_GWB1_40_9]|nr:MAG: Cysteine desulfurase, SufS subfamily [Microgenomates group bacterium GW2011_GWC1_39_12]KKR79901.1 MAG: Cysteine desulfurase, SufS subfamily [Microgenomates group bacterium GW2011_GWB1_40_9]
MISANKIRKDFPLLSRKINGKSIVYLDSTATSLKPASVIDAVNDYYKKFTANVFRGIYTLSEEATCKYEGAREKIARFISAKKEEIVFTKNTDESLSLLSYCYLPYHVKRGDNLVTTIMEHHANFVPWQQYANTHGCKFHIWNVGMNGELDCDELKKLITSKTKLFAITAASNVLGIIPDIGKIVKIVKKANPDCFVVVDAAQAAPHYPIDVVQWGADAVAFSGHKMLGPSGIGVLWAKKNILEDMPPFLFGGDMIREVHKDKTSFNDVPHKFEAGTPYIEGAIGLGAAVDYLSKLGMKNVRKHEIAITTYALKQLQKISGIKIFGPKEAKNRGGVVAFHVAGVHPHDVAQLLNEDNICIRVGYHCAMPLHEHLGIGATCRASFYIYTTREDIDALVAGIKKVIKIFR